MPTPFAEGPERLNIYKVSRLIKRDQNDLYNSLRSIYADSLFVSEIHRLYPSLPRLANLRCGIWYSPRFEASCYFKSTDGHTGNWGFSTTRLNIHVAQLAAQHGGCIIVDATRRGKRYPDSLSKTVPIWCAVLNRAVEELKGKNGDDAFCDISAEVVNGRAGKKYVERDSSAGEGNGSEHSRGFSDVNGGQVESEPRVPESANESDSLPGKDDWGGDEVGGAWRTLHLPLWLSPIEKEAIKSRIEGWVNLLKSSGADLFPLTRTLSKPLRPLWISQRTVIWLNEVADVSTLPFTPVICLSASEPTAVPGHASGGGSGWSYVPGAGDDEESWARGLTPSLFWRNVHRILDSGPSECKGTVSRLVEEEKVRSAMRTTGFGPGAVDWGTRGGCRAKPVENDGLFVKEGVGGQREPVDGAVVTSDVARRGTRGGEGLYDGAEKVADGAGRVSDGSGSDSDGAIGGLDRLRRGSDGSRGESASDETWRDTDWRGAPFDVRKESFREGRTEASDDDVSTGDDDVSKEAGLSREDEGLNGSGDAECTQPSKSEEMNEMESRVSRVKERSAAEGMFQYDERGQLGADSFGPSAGSDAIRGHLGRPNIIGRTGLAVGSASCCEDPAVWQVVDAVLDCSPTLHAGCAQRKGQYLHLPIQGSKFDRRSLERHLPDAVRFARTHLDSRTRMLIVCNDGYDVSVCVCLAILLSCFDSTGAGFSLVLLSRGATVKGQLETGVPICQQGCRRDHYWRPVTSCNDESKVPCTTCKPCLPCPQWFHM